MWYQKLSKAYRGAWLLALLGMCGVATDAYALKEPRPIATDSRIRTVRYSADEVYQFIGHYGYQSSIEFEQDEEILTVSVGDSIAWLINPSGSRLFLKPIEQSALTNMTVLTNKRSYLFELHAEEALNIRDPNLTFVMRFLYPQSDVDAIEFTQFEPLPDIENYPEKYNFNYTLRGIDTIAPTRIFDDGKFTYFEFEGPNKEIPAFFRVDPLNNEELVNFRRRGNYIVVERVASRFTLRRGAEIVCVYNEALPQPHVPQPEKTFQNRARGYTPF
jgi:type IV secretion system protein VirB9